MARLALLAALYPLASIGSPNAQVARLDVHDAQGRPVEDVVVGLPFRVVLTVRPPAGAYPLLPAPLPDPDAEPLAFGDARVLALHRRPPHLDGDARLDTAVYTAAVYTLDSARVGPVEVRLVAGADTAFVQAAAVSLRVAATTPDSARLRPPGPPLDFPRAWGPWALGAALLALAVALAVLAARRWRRWPPRPASPHAHLPPLAEALARLGALEAAPTSTEAAAEAHHVELADLVRTYLARALGLDAHRLTTAGLDARLARDARVPPDARAALVGVLRETDLVKFARRRPAAPDLAAARTQARTALDTVERALQPAPAEEAPSPA